MERLTKRTAEGIAYLANVKQDEQVIEGSRNTLQCLYDSWQKLAEYEDAEESGKLEREVANDLLEETYLLLKKRRERHMKNIFIVFDNNDGRIQIIVETLQDAQRYCDTQDRKSTRLNSSHSAKSRMPSSA